MASDKKVHKPPGVKKIKPYNPGKERPPAIDKLLKPTAIAVVAIAAYRIFKGINTGLPRIDHTDAAALRKLLYGTGSPGAAFPGSASTEKKGNYVVLCHPEGSSRPVSSVFSDASTDPNVFGSSVAEFAVLDCDLATAPPKAEGDNADPAAPSVADIFKIDTTVRPTVFVSGSDVDGHVKQVPTKHLRTGSMLVKAVRSLLEKSAVKVENSKDLKNKCLDADYCGLLLKGTSKAVEPYVKEIIRNLANEYPQVQFASLDAASTILSIEETVPEYIAGQHRFLMFKKVSGTAKAPPAKSKKKEEGSDADEDDEDDDEDPPKKNAAGRLITSLRPYLGATPLSYPYLSEYIAGIVGGKLEINKIPALPTIKMRTKKNEEAVAAKRKRAAERKRREEQQRQGGIRDETAGMDSKAERKAKRDELRAEHYKKNDVKERTPEELAEMERARRKRMEEESAKWNVMEEGEEDPEEEDPEGEDGGMDMFEDLDDEGFVDIDESDEDGGDSDDIDLD